MEDCSNCYISRATEPLQLLSRQVYVWLTHCEYSTSVPKHLKVKLWSKINQQSHQVGHIQEE